jgi:hypothetical protein
MWPESFDMPALDHTGDICTALVSESICDPSTGSSLLKNEWNKLT